MSNPPRQPYGPKTTKALTEVIRSFYGTGGNSAAGGVTEPSLRGRTRIGKFSNQGGGTYGTLSSFGNAPYYIGSSPVEIGYRVGGTWHGSGIWTTVWHSNDYGVHLENKFCVMHYIGGQWETDTHGLSKVWTTTTGDNTFTLGGMSVPFIGEVDMDGVSEGGSMAISLGWEPDSQDWRLISQDCEEME